MKDFFGNEFSTAEMYKLVNLLTQAKIPFEVGEILGTLQVFYPQKKNPICDAICHAGSYGHEEGLLEIMGLVEGDSVEGYLTAEEVFERIKKNYEENSGK